MKSRKRPQRTRRSKIDLNEAWERSPEVQARLRRAAKELRAGKTISLRAFAKRHKLLAENVADAASLKRAIRTSRSTITHTQLLERL